MSCYSPWIERLSWRITDISLLNFPNSPQPEPPALRGKQRVHPTEAGWGGASSGRCTCADSDQASLLQQTSSPSGVRSQLPEYSPIGDPRDTLALRQLPLCGMLRALVRPLTSSSWADV